MLSVDTPISVITTTRWERGRLQEGEGGPQPWGQGLAIHEERGEPTDDEEEGEEQRDPRQHVGAPDGPSTSKRIPLTTKKIGMRKPKPTALNRGSSSSRCWGARAMRSTMPAVNAPSNVSRPSWVASRSMSASSSTAIRTGSCAEVCTLRWRLCTTAGGWGRDAT